MKQTLILGNIITMDEKRPTAQAALVKDGVFAFIGGAEEAKELAGADVRVLDYGDNFIYPGFLESHSHGYLAGDRAIGQADLTKAGLTTDYAKYREIIKEFIAKNPQREVYMAAGWIENDEYVTKAYLDEICPDKPLIMNTGGGHSMLLNSKALEWAGIDKAYAEKYGPAEVHVDENGEPDGYICETPVFEVMPKVPKTLEDAKNYLLAWQDIALENGYTGAADAGVEIVYPEATQAYYELEQEGKLKLRTYAYLKVAENAEDPKGEIARAVADRAKYSNEYFHVVGVKTFLDGVVEAHTGWQIDEYLDQPGYYGLERFNKHDKMVELICAADAEGLSVHVHSVGNGATRFMLDCVEEAEKITGDMDQRNVMAHLQFVTDEDVRRMGATGTVPAVPPLWAGKDPDTYRLEVSYVGQEMADKAYPIKSFFDAGANVVFHSDYPVSPSISVPDSFYMAETRAFPASYGYGDGTERWIEEAITREQSLRALTINVAHAWHQEHRLGSIEFGKVANMTVSDCDFLHDDVEKVTQAKVVATIVDGEEAYKA
ncbi:MAG: amidohydrolase [Eggerthellaceae bacterium]|nr:amidohydrolase [Eggerthellaceae bacterium]